jgi:glycosyltransferase involved in cell wall biosynthesis
LHVAYTLEQCWHDVPGGTAVAALAVLERLARREDVVVHAVAGRHRRPPVARFEPPVPVGRLPVARPWLYETWLRFGWPLVESVTGPVDVCHATALVPAPSRAPGVVTVHDLAFVRRPEQFSAHGARVMRRSLDGIRRGEQLVLCSSTHTMQDLVDAGVRDERLRFVPLGVDVRPVTPAAADTVRRRHGLPERFVLFVGTLEPRKNLARLAAAVARVPDPPLLVVAGAVGWGDVATQLQASHDAVRVLGFVDDEDLDGLYAAATVVAYPSEWEGFGLPVAEAMAQGAAVVTSRGTPTEEVAGGAAVLVDPFDVDDIARGLADAERDRALLAPLARRRAEALSWDVTAEATVAAYREAAP